MNQDLENLDKVNQAFNDEWLTDNLKFTQLEPPKDFTQNVMEQIEVKPNPLNGSILWVIAIVPGVILVWLVLYFLGSAGSIYNFDLSFIPKVSSLISFYSLCKYAIMITLAGLFFVGIDHYLSKSLSHRESMFSFVMI
jgi:hypothetical protein